MGATMSEIILMAFMVLVVVVLFFLTIKLF